jgi:hypothetical protein
VNAPLARVVVTFTQEVDASLVNETTVVVEKIADLEPGATSHSVSVASTRALAADNAAVLLITPRVPLDPGVYRVTLRGTGGAALANLNAATLGVNSSFEFTVEPAP